MAIYDRFFKLFRGSNPNNPNNPIIPPLDVSNTYSGEAINEDTAIRISAVWACIRVLSESIASLPLEIYKKDKDGNKTLQPKHPLYTLLHSQPNKIMTSFMFRETLQTHLCLHGNAYVKIIRNNAMRPISLEIINPSVVSVKLVEGELYYHLKKTAYNKDEVIHQDDILHLAGLSFDGMIGKSPISVARENLGLTLAAQTYGSAFFGNGASLSGVLEHPSSLSKEAAERLAYSWNQKFQGAQQAHKTAVLEEGLKYKAVSIPPEDAQFLETRKFQVTEICRIFRIPNYLVGDLERATYSNIEQQSIDFVVYTLRPWLVRWEQELNRKLFKESEKGKLTFKFNIDGLLRGDSKSRAEYYKDLFNVGALSPNDVRRLENLNPIENGDDYYVQVNMAPVSKFNSMNNDETPITDDE